MSGNKHSYENDIIKVSYDGSKCAHAGYCFGELHDVFDGDRDPPIKLSGASTEEIIRVVEKCPSSALTYQRLDGGTNEVVNDVVTAVLIPNGPLALRGDLKIKGQTYTRLTLCRCGKSKQKPFCDGSHHKHQFDDGETVDVEEVKNIIKSEQVKLTASNNGPVFFVGEITFESSDKQSICQRERGAICRCGASKKKPFCDGSHNGIEFRTN
jgi:CDGSH-type Zn-finger protein/uncharacterized Fe-S cluster protein YjdI